MIIPSAKSEAPLIIRKWFILDLPGHWLAIIGHYWRCHYAGSSLPREELSGEPASIQRLRSDTRGRQVGRLDIRHRRQHFERTLRSLAEKRLGQNGGCGGLIAPGHVF